MTRVIGENITTALKRVMNVKDSYLFIQPTVYENSIYFRASIKHQPDLQTSRYQCDFAYYDGSSYNILMYWKGSTGAIPDIWIKLNTKTK